MNVEVFQHVPFETAANIGVWVIDKGYRIHTTHWYNGERAPRVSEYDWLVIMGGPMNIYQYDEYPWLIEEKKAIREAIEAEKKVLGVCLGGQLIADVLGGEISQNPETEIGWFPCQLTDAGRAESLMSGLSNSFTAFHWHGDTFSIPPAAVRLASSKACVNQAFQYGDRVLGMQFHFDYAYEDILGMVENCADELVEGAYIQRDREVLMDVNRISMLSANLATVLEALDRV